MEVGNGSPVFGCQWWHDEFAKNIRLQEIGIYPSAHNTGSTNNVEDIGLLQSSQFYIPYETIPLPGATIAMSKTEKKFREYQERRMEEEQDMVYQANQESESKSSLPRPKVSSSSPSSSSLQNEPDIIMSKTKERLAQIYYNSDNDNSTSWIDNNATDNTTIESDSFSSNGQKDKAPRDDDDYDDYDEIEKILRPNHSIQAQDDDYMEDWMKEKIQNAVNNLETVKSKKLIEKIKPPIEDNPVFKAYKEGTLVPEDQKRKPKIKDLGPYPGKDHFVGIWKTSVGSPTGFDVDDSSQNASENLILRVDGTTFGGPTLNVETKQKAAGGTWKMIVEENGDVRLRIRLVIPPEKKRILEMEGIIQRFSPQTMPSRSFGIPLVEKRAQEANHDRSGLMTCSGEVSIIACFQPSRVSLMMLLNVHFIFIF